MRGVGLDSAREGPSGSLLGWKEWGRFHRLSRRAGARPAPQSDEGSDKEAQGLC